MSTITVKFLTDNKIADYKTQKLELAIADVVLVDTNQVKELACVINVQKSKTYKGATYQEGEGKIVRAINEKDKVIIKKLKQDALKFIPKCIEKIKKYDLSGMKIIDADLSYDTKKLTIYFASSARIDFRTLVSDLVRSFKKIIRLQQIGARERAKLVDGYGKCGRKVCCSAHLVNLEEINFDLAKEQGLIDSGTGRISGNCGKPMCCLKYEIDSYRKTYIKMPKIGLKLKTKQGIGEIVERNIFKNTVTVKLPDKTKIELPV